MATFGFALLLGAPSAFGAPRAKPRPPPTAPAACVENVPPSASTEELYRHGQCQEQKGHLVKALEHYQAGLRKLPAKAVVQRIQARIDVVVRQLAALRIDVVGASGAELVVEGQAFPPGAERKFDPGLITIVASAPGFETKTQTVELATGEARSMTISLQVESGAAGSPPNDPRTATSPAPAPAASPTAPVDGRRSESSTVRSIGYVTLGVGGVAVLGGLVTGALAMARAGVVRRECPTVRTCSAEGVDAARAGESFSTASTLSVIGGGVLGLAGAALVIFAPSSNVRIEPRMGGIELIVKGM